MKLKTQPTPSESERADKIDLKISPRVSESVRRNFSNKKGVEGGTGEEGG